jgi:simple sugar transport system permease protein
VTDLGQLLRDRRLGNTVAGLLRAEHSPVPLACVALLVFGVFSIAKPSVFPSASDIQAMAFALPEVGLLALAVMLSMVIAGIDLSVVGTANLAAVAMGEFYAHGWLTGAGWVPVALGALVALGAGAACGVLNGLVIGLIGVSDILATLATGYIFGGLALAWTGGDVLSRLPGGLGDLGIATVAEVPVIFAVFVVAAVLVAVLLNRSRFGLRAMLTGSNVTAARLSGIRRPRVILGTYVTTGVLAGLAGIIFTARTADVTATYGSSYLLLAVVIAVLGGVDPNGGSGTVLGVVLGAAVLQMLQTGFDVVNFNQFLYQAVQGLILIAVLAINVRARFWPAGADRPAAPAGNDSAVPLGPAAAARRHE